MAAELGAGGLVLVLGPAGLAIIAGVVGRVMVLRHRARRDTIEDVRLGDDNDGPARP